MHKFFDVFYRHGYVAFHKEPNNIWLNYGRCIEYSFIKVFDDGPVDCEEAKRIQNHYFNQQNKDKDTRPRAIINRSRG